MDSGNLARKIPNLEGLQKDIFYLIICFLIIGFTAAAHNAYTPDDPVNVGYVEIETNCEGTEIGDYCLGVQRQQHTSYNYDEYEKPDPGTENFYRRVEAELMLQAYDICDSQMNGMEWTDKAEYRNQTGTEWFRNENIQLLPCEQTYYRNISAAK